MPQVSDLDPITVFGDPPSEAPRALRPVRPRSRPTESALVVFKRWFSELSWWRVALTFFVIAVWLASALNASAASINLAAEASKNTEDTWGIAVEYAASNVVSAARRDSV